MNIIRIALIAPQEKDRQQLREQMFSYAVRWKVAVVTDCFDCLEEFAMAAQSGGYQLVCLRGGERQWRAAEELRRIRGEGETLWAYLEEGQALRAKVLTAADTFGAVEWRRVSGMNTVMTDYFALAPRHARDAILPIKHPLRTDDIHYIQAQKQTLLLYTAYDRVRARLGFQAMALLLDGEPQFLICPGGLILNTDKVSRVEGRVVALENGKRLMLEEPGGPGAPGPPGGPPFPYAGANGLSQMTQTVFCAIIGQIPQREGDDFMKYEDIRRQVLTAIRQASAQGLIHGTSGNISVRDREAGVAAITPSGRPYDTMEPGDIAIVTLDGEWVDGPYAPSSETPMHTAVYRARPDVGAVVHNHALFCTVMAMAVDELPPSTPPQAEFAPIRVVPFAVPGSRALAASVAAALGTDGLAVLLRNHGSLCCGRDLPAAMTAAAYVEEAAQVAYYASALGRFTPLGEADIRACKEMLAAGRAV